MKQLDLFKDCVPEHSSTSETGQIEWHVFTDGASRSNPGRAGAGVYILKKDIPVFRQGFYLGHKTNNQAEYLALIFGLYYAKKQMNPTDVIIVMADSELMVKQMQGKYKVRNAALKPLHAAACKLLEGISYSVCHIYREHNTDADRMANLGIDKQMKISPELHSFLKRHDISV